MDIAAARAFLDTFLAAEVLACEAKRGKDLDLYNQRRDAVHALTVGGLSLNLGRMIMLFPDSFYDDAHLWHPIVPRHVFKIEQHEHPTQGTIFRCTVSFAEPRTGDFNPAGRRGYGHLLIVGEVEGTPRTMAEFVRDGSKWRFVGGDDAFKGWKPTRPVAVERFVEPVGEAADVKDWKK